MMHSICRAFDYSMLKMWLLSIAFLLVKKNEEPLSGFSEVEFMDLVSEN
jgi:hypothetical protein